MEVTAKLMRLRDLYRKTAKRHARRWSRYEGDTGARGDEARKRRADLDRYAQELGLRPNYGPDEPTDG